VAYASESDSINCPCHGSTFALDGASTGGPAGRSLDRYKAVISGDKVEVDFSKVYKEGKDGYDGAVATIG
jgi:Rieske Fe-S protein